jgi:hypothetical protein
VFCACHCGVNHAIHSGSPNSLNSLFINAYLLT